MPTNNAQFQAQFKAEMALQLQAAYGMQKLMALTGLRGVVLKNRWDTGRARGNWQATMGSPADGQLDRLDPTGAVTIADESAKILSMQDAFGVIYLTNNVDYIEVLEDMDHMVALTEAELQGAFPG